MHEDPTAGGGTNQNVGTYTVVLGTEPTAAVTVTIASSDGGAVSRAPGALTFDATSWETAQAVTAGPDPGTTPGSAMIAHTVTGYGSGPTVRVNEDEDATPTLGAVAAQTYRVGQRVSVRLPWATGGNPPLRYALTGGTPPPLMLPAGLSFDGTTRRLQGTPRAEAAAATYTYTVTDADAATPPRTFTLTVAANPLTFGTATVALQQYPLNRAIEEPQEFPRPMVTGNPILTFVVEPALPAGLTYEPPTRQVTEGVNTYPHGGRIVGTPTEATPQRGYTLTVVDGQGNVARVPFALATDAAAVSPDPGLADRQPTFGDATVEAQRYTVGTTVTDGDGRLTYTLTGPAPPAGPLAARGGRGVWRGAGVRGGSGLAARRRGRAVRAGARRSMEHVDAPLTRSARSDTAAERLGRAGRLRRPDRAGRLTVCRLGEPGRRSALRHRLAPWVGRLRPRLGPIRFRPRARGDAAGRPGRRVAGAGAIPPGVGGGGLGAERVRAAVEPTGAARRRQRH